MRVVFTGAISLFLFINVFASNAAYYLIEKDGYVAVEDAESRKILRTDIRVDRLPRSDAELLEQGIACADKTEVAAALENFDS